MPTLSYDAPSGKFGKIFVGIMSIELDRFRAKKWNAERVTVFQSVILQRSHGVNNSAKIRKHIFLKLNLWNCGAFGELVKDTYNFAMGYLKSSLESNYRGRS